MTSVSTTNFGGSFFFIFIADSFLRSLQQIFNMNKVFIFGLVIAALVAVSFAEDLPCDRQMGVRICTNRNGECINNIEFDPETQSEDYHREKCRCIVKLGDCLDRVECNGTTMWSAMVMCTNENCTGCQFYATSASTVFPTIALILIAFFALFM